MEPQRLDEQLDEVIDEIDGGRQRPAAAVLAWLDHAIADRLGMDVGGFSRQEYEDLRLDLFEVLVAGVIIERMGWDVLEER